MSAKDDLMKKARQLKEEVVAKKEAEAVKSSHSDLPVNATGTSITNSAELLKMLADNVDAGSENVGGKSPQLKIHSTGRSSTNQLKDGKEPNNGWYFYQPTQEQFEKVECHILSISKGYYVEDKMNPMNTKKRYNQLMGGVLIDRGVPKFFVMYIAGLKLRPMWDFMKEVADMKMKYKVPMYALKVLMGTEQVKTDKGMMWIPKFSIVKNDDQTPMIVSDIRAARFLQDRIRDAKNMFDIIIQANATEEAPKDLETVEDEHISDPKEEVSGEVVNPDDIPF